MNTELETEIESSQQIKLAWEKPELEICQLSQTLNGAGSGPDGGGRAT